LWPSLEKNPFRCFLLPPPPPPKKNCVDLCVLSCIIVTCLQSDEILECVCSRTYMPYHYIVGRNYLNIVSASMVTSITIQLNIPEIYCFLRLLLVL